MIELAPYSNAAAMQVARHLDAYDLLEAQILRAQPIDHLDIFADWRSVQPGAVLSLVLCDASAGGMPFGLLGLVNTGQAGVANAALIARDHGVWRRPLAVAGLQIRRQMPAFCAEWGIHRIEARCWAEHPTAARFLRACGFTHDCDLPGYGPGGGHTFQQFAWTNHDPIIGD
ncbi:hypothetical protein KZZ08_00565 [Roseovarius mucosus]|uniref:hypothetical protein n=1 Tax=Roseovarius mucosus TaxID=215743 RepID=UPI001C5D6F4E|nr:hypothetical protein [Roseovarius mucosus]MBW4972088.1 hypothetical protein [Roseovarius mucosus]